MLVTWLLTHPLVMQLPLGGVPFCLCCPEQLLQLLEEAVYLWQHTNTRDKGRRT
jgi:hypothetical protein